MKSSPTMRQLSSVNEKHPSKGKRAGYALLCLGLAALLVAYLFAVFGGDTPPSERVIADHGQAAVAPPAHAPASAGRSVEPEPAATETNLSNTAAEPDSVLQEAELEHLGEVFMNSVYPLFQYDFPLNNEGRSALDVFVASMPQGLSGEDLDTIATMIETRLASPETEDLAFIITHLYRLEQEEARITRERAPVTTMADQLEVQEQLSQLREQWFGPELSKRLFSGAEDVPGAEGAGEVPESLAEEQSELAAIESDWEQRYQKFLAEKQVIERAGLDQAEKDRQIEALMRQHYTAQELQAVRAFDQSRK
ncbi:MAG: lipase secretion chaperone [Marinobacter sp.]|uniref:lipase secretion chaperone n=1 Tax=Marinobacter sp. TaxID=50741 RepID=UPI00329888F1